MAALRLNLGAPGIYRYPEREVLSFRPARMDVCAFLGVAPRGPARLPYLEEYWRYDKPCVEPNRDRRRSVAVPVESFEAYRRLFGGFEGPGLLPYAVSVFFEQGGQRAYVVRIVHDYGDAALNSRGVARGMVNASFQRLVLKSAAFSQVKVEVTPEVRKGPILRLSLPNGEKVLRLATDVSQEAGAGGQGQVSRIVLDQPLNSEPEGAEIAEGILLEARSEGTWGNDLRAALGFSVRFLALEAGTLSELTFPKEEVVPTGSLLRLTLPTGLRLLRFAAQVCLEERQMESGEVWRVSLDQPIPAPAAQAEMVEGILALDDGVTSERHEQLGLSAQHPRRLATVLCYDSDLVFPHQSWVEGEIRPRDVNRLPLEPVLDGEGAVAFGGGLDRYAEISPEDFFDPSWVPGSPEPGDGICSLAHLPDFACMVAPDLYAPEALVPAETVVEEPSLVGGKFEPCPDYPTAKPTQATPVTELENLYLDPRIPGDLEKITSYQERMVELAELLGSFVVLLDVPPGLTQRQILSWRARFRSSYGAAYHPWLKVPGQGSGADRLIRLNPAASAAGIIAQQENLFGVPHGPANVLAVRAVDVLEQVTPARHDELHQAGINVFIKERDGIRLTGARTLARDARYRQLSVRRLMLMLRRVLEQQNHWMVFEPNGPALWSEVSQLLQTYLRELFRLGAFKGASEEEAFFVRCDETLNPTRVVDAGQMIAEIGVAPAEPLEFLVVRLTQSLDGAPRLVET